MNPLTKALTGFVGMKESLAITANTGEELELPSSTGSFPLETPTES